MAIGKQLTMYMEKNGVTEEALRGAGITDPAGILSGKTEPTRKEMQILTDVLVIPDAERMAVFFPEYCAACL